MLPVFCINRLDAFETLNCTSTCMYLKDLLNIGNIHEQVHDKTYPKDCQLNQANFSNTKVSFFLNIMI